MFTSSSAFNDAAYSEVITDDNIMTLTHFDLTELPYHGGSTFSSGVLPKWDIHDNTYMIKRCGIDEYGNYLTDAVNEELVYLFCKSLNINAAYYRTVMIRYRDAETNKIIEAPAVLTKIFDGLVHYVDIRRTFSFGQAQDELLDLTERFNIMPALNDIFFLDFIFNQQDRHSKNIGLIGNDLSPIFDSGACLLYDILDSELSPSYYDRIPKHKTFGKPLDELLKFSLSYVYCGFSFTFDADNIKTVFESAFQTVQHHYGGERIKFIKEFVNRRIDCFGQILAEA